MYENVTQEVLLERMLARVSDKLDKRPSSVIYDTHAVTSIELQILYIELDTLITNSFGDTAAREFLILLAKDRGLSPEPATHAVLKGEFTPTTIDVTGQRFNIGDMNYVVLGEMTPDEVGDDYKPTIRYYKVQCEEVGEVGNQFLGQMIPMEYIDGLETATLTDLLIPGEDEEDTEVFRQRYFDSFKEQTFSGNRADYLAKVRSIDGVGDVKVTRVWNGDISPADMIPSAAVETWYKSVISTLSEEVATWLSAVYYAAAEKKLTVGGTVLVTIVDSDDFSEASTTLIDHVQSTLDPEQNAGEGYGLAPMGHVVNVKSALGIKLYITASVVFEEGYNWSNCKGVIEEAVGAYFLELRQAWSNTTYTVVRISQIENRILGIQGVVDISGTKINGVASNITLGQYEIPILGGVSA